MKNITFDDVLKTYKSKEAGIKALSKHQLWFPLTLNPKIAGIVADLMADGHLQHPPMWRMDYTSASLEELQRLNKELKEVFGLSFEIRPCTTNTYGKSFLLGISCKPLGRIMSLCGVPHGSKVLTSFNVPEWITNERECFRRFLQRLFDCEGSIDEVSHSIDLRMWKEESFLENGLEFFETLKLSLQKHFGIVTHNIIVIGRNKRKDGKVTRGILLRIKRKSEVVKFLGEIGFENEIKQNKLEKVVQKIKQKGGAGGI